MQQVMGTVNRVLIGRAAIPFWIAKKHRESVIAVLRDVMTITRNHNLSNTGCRPRCIVSMPVIS